MAAAVDKKAPQAAGDADGELTPEQEEAEKARLEKLREQREKDLAQITKLGPEERFSFVQRRLGESPDDTRESAMFGFAGFCRDSERVQAAARELDLRVQELRKSDSAFAPYESRWQQAERATAEQTHALKRIQEEYRKTKRSYDATMTLVITGAAGVILAGPAWWYTSEGADDVSQLMNMGALAIGGLSLLLLLFGLPSLPAEGRKRAKILASLTPAQAAHKAASGQLKGLMEGESGARRRALDAAIAHLGDQLAKFDAQLAASALEYAASAADARKVAEDAIVTYLRNFPPEAGINGLERLLGEMSGPPPWFRGAARDATERMIADREIFKRLARESYDYVLQRFTAVVVGECPSESRDRALTVLVDRAGLARQAAEQALSQPGSALSEGVPQFESELVKKYLVDAGVAAEVRTGPSLWPKPRPAK
jgi:hypothetical protein